jgi:apolipoprotein D and lipocalin family protein
MRIAKYIFLMSILTTLFGCSSGRELQTVDSVDLEKYAGKWFEIARLPNSFEEGCECTTAEYGVEEKYVSVTNRCYDMEKQEWKDINGKAFPVKGTNNSELKVQFFWPFRGDYYIVDLDENYQHALVGSPNRKFLWLLSRTPQMDEREYIRLIEKAKELGFDTDQLIKVRHGCDS